MGTFATVVTVVGSGLIMTFLTAMLLAGLMAYTGTGSDQTRKKIENVGICSLLTSCLIVPVVSVVGLVGLIVERIFG